MIELGKILEMPPLRGAWTPVGGILGGLGGEPPERGADRNLCNEPWYQLKLCEPGINPGNVQSVTCQS